VSALPNDSFWVREGALLAGPYPGSKEPSLVRPKLAAMLELGVRDFIDLTEEDEHLDPYDFTLSSASADLGVDATHQRFPIRDVSIPTPELMQEALAAIRRSMDAERIAYVHCWGGVGRTGTVLGCLLLEDGVPEGEVFAEITRLRSRTAKTDRSSPETAEQCQFVLDWLHR